MATKVYHWLNPGPYIKTPSVKRAKGAVEIETYVPLAEQVKQMISLGLSRDSLLRFRYDVENPEHSMNLELDPSRYPGFDPADAMTMIHTVKAKIDEYRASLKDKETSTPPTPPADGGGVTPPSPPAEGGGASTTT